MAKVKKIEENHIHFEREDGKEFTMDKSKPLHLDHGYCSTVHSAQGRTCERVLMDADVHSLTSFKDTYYVALSRARTEAKIYTNDRERFPEIMSRGENVKEAALEIDRDSKSHTFLKSVPHLEKKKGYELKENELER